MFYWKQENQTATCFLRSSREFPGSRLFTYDIMKNVNCTWYKTSNIGNFYYKKNQFELLYAFNLKIKMHINYYMFKPNI